MYSYIDSDWVSCIDDIKSTLGFMLSFSSSVILCIIKKQECVALKPWGEVCYGYKYNMSNNLISKNSSTSSRRIRWTN